MTRRNGILIYTADDEMPDCLSCDNCDSDEYYCSNFCGHEHGWFGYKRTEKEDVEDK